MKLKYLNDDSLRHVAEQAVESMIEFHRIADLEPLARSNVERLKKRLYDALKDAEIEHYDDIDADERDEQHFVPRYRQAW